MELVPREVDKYLTKGETFERQYNLRDATVYILGKKLLIKKGHLIRDIDYSHIKSVKYERERRVIALFGGIVLLIFAVVITQFFGIDWLAPPALGLVAIGIIMSVVGFIPRERVELNITGQSVPLKLRAVDRFELDSLYKLIVERKP